MNKTIVLSVFLSTLVWQGQAAENEKEYALWYTAPACNRGGDFTHVISRGFPFDTDWDTWSLPIGNGAMGACIFGRTDTERIQISEKTLSYKGPYNDGGDKGTFTNFVEVYLDFNHRYYKNYKRSLSLDDAISTVSYEYDGVKYTREYFANYPSQAIVIKIKADVAGKVSFKLHPELPYLHPFDSENNGRTGTVTAKGDLITLRGEMQIHKQRYEGQIKVVNYGGSALAAGSAINVNQADSVVLYIATGTDYKLNDNVFLLLAHRNYKEILIRTKLYRNYQCKGCTFDQSMILETYRDLLHAASILKIKDPFLKTIEKEIPRLNPIEIGESGQIKEFREEKKYGDIGEVHHRHISHLCALYPGTMITSATPEWMKAAAVSLTMRGDKSTGWAMAHRQVSWARLKNGEKAYQLYKGILSERVMQNLWAFHPPFQIDANLGATAGVAEMLLQSHEGYIEPLPALPKAWKNGSYEGLMARGNFQISAQWKDGKAVSFCIVSNKGEICRLKYTGIENASITDNRGKTVKTIKVGDDLVEFKTKQGIEYTVTF